MQARNFACVLFRQKERKKDDFPFLLARVPTCVAALVTRTGCRGHLHRVGLDLCVAPSW